MLEIRNLSFQYDKHAPFVLQDLNLSLKDGEIGILLGKNGSGKTTLFKNIIGLEKQAEGTIFFDGEDLSKVSRIKRAGMIGYVPQDIRFGALSVFDSVMVGRVASFGLRPGKEDVEAVEKVLSQMGLEGYAGKNVERLSGGERQKVAIARALAQNPKMLVFDEPTGNLDIANEHLFLKEARTLADDLHLGILTSLHDLNQALLLGDRFFFLKEGKIIYNVSRQEVTREMIQSTFDAEIRMFNIEGEKIVLGGLL